MLKCTVVSPRAKKVFEGLEGIFVKTVTGEVGILAGHMAIVAQLRDGATARLKTYGGEVRIQLGAGSFFRFSDDAGILLTRDFVEEGART